ncbi:Guanine nucleotide-binding protein, beta subunit [Parasponia andersonii]|uniref:Guanine nucleotide-binding protein, beta subunit n=1 Tax=Parasponia andersonii TaxID=3476 RepID=A0A2P5DQI8_PARAD|nr:Guanine nucleotide-binding protein, beta subunit [Parasponia andersonii]
MTKQSESRLPPMELDLNSFLDSHLSSDDDDDDDQLNTFPHRTIDDILKDSDSSSSSSPPPSPPSALRRLSSDPDRPSSASKLSSESSMDETHKPTDASKPTQLEERPVGSRTGSFGRFKSGESSDDVFRRLSRPLPSLFGGVRSNAKPGAALAAAAAASRSMPPPHAAAIKSRRSSGTGGFQKVLDGGDSGSTACAESETASDELGSNSNGDLNAVSLELSRSGTKLVEDSNNDEKRDEISRRDGVSESSFEGGEVLHCKEPESEGEGGTEVDESRRDIAGEGLLHSDTETQVGSTSVNIGNDFDFEKNSAVSYSDHVENRTVGTNYGGENERGLNESSTFVDVSYKNEKGSSYSFFDGDNNGDIAEELETAELDTGHSLKDPPSLKDNDEGLAGDDASSTNEINELVEERIERLESRMISQRAEKKSRPRMKPLEVAEELEKKYASTGMHWEEGAAAQPMRLEGVRRGSTTLGYFDVDANNTITRTISSQAFRRDYGSSQVLAVHANYIAVGMARGVVVVVPSKYSAHNADDLDGKMVVLGSQGERSHSAVTSLCFNQQGDFLLAGYGDGHITVWDVQRASAAKVITGEHTAPVVHALFLGQDSQVTRQFKAVTGDNKGLVLLHALSVVPLLNRFTIKTTCLLDGQRTGTVLSASPLLFDEVFGGTSLSCQGNAMGTASSIGSMMGGVVGGDAGWKLFNEGSSLVEEGVVIFVTHQTALVVRLTPTLEIYSQLSRPDGAREGSIPYTAWKCTTQSHNISPETLPTEASEKVSLLAVAWDRKVQVAKLVKTELKVYGGWSLDSAAIGVAWLDDQMLVVLTVTGQLCLFANDGTVIHQTSFVVDGSPGDDLIAYHTHFINIFGNPEKSYHNCLAVRGASIYILGPAHLIVSRLLPWKERIQVLRKAGDWMGALNMAMTIYDGQAHGVIDLPRTLDAVQEAIMPYLVELLLSYVEEVFSYISVAFCNQIEKMDLLDNPSNRSSSVYYEIKEQYTRVGGVAVEFCVHIKRTDILFDEIFSKFVAVQQKDTFLELLEPYILKDMLGSLPPEIMQALVEHYSSKGWLQRVEQCVLHMDISSLDFNQIVRLCREHGLYGALFYLFNKGLDDFRAPLEELLAVLQNSQREAVAALGYRMLVYLKYCFSGLAFPPEHGNLPPSRLPSLREELLQFLLEDSDAHNSRVGSSLSSRAVYLNLYPLLELDTEATLDVLRCAFVEDEIPQAGLSSHNLADTGMEMNEENISMESQKLMVQNTVDALIRILGKDMSQVDRSSSGGDEGSVKEWPSMKEIGHLFEFIAHYVACGSAKVSKRVLSQILEYLTSEDFQSSASAHSIISKRREKQVLSLLKVVPQTDWDSSNVFHLCEKAHFYQVCGLIHTIRHQYLPALDSYMKDVDEPIHAFSFINRTLLELSDNNDRAAFQSAVIDRIPELVELNREATFFLVIDHLNDEGSHILSKLRSHPKSLFLYLKTSIEIHLSGTLNFDFLRKDNIMSMKDKSEGVEAYLEKISDFPKFLRNNPVHVTDDMIELYLENTLEVIVANNFVLPQEHGIIDAASFLLERVGDVGSALLLTLSSLNNKFVKLADAMGSGAAGIGHFSSIKKLEEVKEIESILHACIGLCQRNTPRLNPEESEILWFRLLDSFCEPLMGSFGDSNLSEGGNPNRILAESPDPKDFEESSIIRWRIPRSLKGAHILRKLFSQFIKEIVEGMIGYVRLPTIMSKLLSDNGSQEFGDFKLTILGMLGTYGFERRILDTAKSLIEDDTFYTMSLLKKGASHGYAPRSQICCICNGLLAKNPSSSSIRVFNCGHATHLQCELLEKGASSVGSSSGCPVCMPNKKLQKSRNKSVLVENGLVKKSSSRPQQTHGTTIYPHDIDSSDYAYGLQQISRFEMLNMLQKEQRFVQVENMPQLRLAPPAVYHEKVKKGTDLLTGESSTDVVRTEKHTSRSKQLKDLKVKGSSLRFPLKSNMFGKEKISKR